MQKDKIKKGWQESRVQYPGASYNHLAAYASLANGAITLTVDYPSEARAEGYRVWVGGRNVSRYTRKTFASLEDAKAQALKIAKKLLKELQRDLEGLENQS